MLIDIYQSRTNREKFIYVPAGTDIELIALEELDADYNDLAIFETSVDAQSSDQTAAFDSAAIIQNVSDHGFSPHVARAAVTQSQA